MYGILLPKGTRSQSRDLLKFWKISDNISETVQDRDMEWLQWTPNRKSFVAYRLAPLPMPMNNFEGHFWCLKPL